MMFSILLVIFISISQASAGSLLTGNYDPNSTSLINDRRDIKEIDVLRQIINQETLIRLAVVKDVKAIVDDVGSVKLSMASSETMVSTLRQTVERLQKQIDSLSQDNNLQQKVETLQSQFDNLSQDNSLQQKVETLQRQVDSLSQDNALQRKVETLQRQIDSVRHENMIQESDQMLKIFMENITDIHDLKSSILQIIKKDLNINKDCKDLYINGYTKSGVYEINPFGIESKINVFCDMVTEGGGWTAIQRRLSGSVSFDRTWAEYRNGFGNLSDSYWLGNDVIHQLTKRGNVSLYVSITLRNGTKLYELYNQFSVADETNNYRLFLGGPATGTLGDRMLNTGVSSYDLSGLSFSTPDRDNDRYRGDNCAAFSHRRGGWWFNYCNSAFLNGRWSSTNWYYPWYPVLRNGREIKGTAMMIKPH